MIAGNYFFKVGFTDGKSFDRMLIIIHHVGKYTTSPADLQMGRRPNPPCTAQGFPSLKTVSQILIFFALFFEVLVKNRE